MAQPELYSRHEIVKLYRSGLSQRQVAEQVGVSRGTVQRVVAEHARGKTERQAQAVAGGRLSRNEADWIGSGSAMRTVVPPHDYAAEWRTLDVNRTQLRGISPRHLIDLLVNISPDISRAIWDTLRMINPGYELIARKPGTSERDERGQAILDAIQDKVAERHGSFATILDQMAMAMFVRGALLVEGVLDPSATELLDIVVPDPMSIRFRKYHDPLYGESFELGQWQSGEWVNLERPTIIYLPVDAMLGAPYGRAPITPAIFPSLFLLSVMHDLKRVIAQAGYLRVNIRILVDKVQEALAIEDVDTLVDEINRLIAETEAAWHAQEPDDSYIYPDYIEIVEHEGAMTVGGESLAGADSLISALERMLVRALKSMPIVMGSAEGVSEANADRQWEMYMATIASLQKKIVIAIERLGTLAMQVAGVQAEADMTFDQVRASEAYRDAQTDMIKVKVATAAEDAGYFTHNEGSQYFADHDAVAPRLAIDIEPPENSATDGESDVDQELDRLMALADGYGRPLFTSRKALSSGR